MEKVKERRCCCSKSSFHHKTQVQAEGWKLLQQNFRTFSNSIYLFTWLFVEQYYWCFRLLWLGENDKYIPEECHVINLYCHITKENVFIGPKIIVDCRHSGNLEKELKLHHHQNGSWNGRMNHRIIEGVGLERTLQPTQLQPPAVGWLPPTKSGCPGPHPPWPWAPPGMGLSGQQCQCLTSSEKFPTDI